ncbi:MAG: PAS domain-containing protein [Desulfobacterales bacterium]
MTDSADIFKIFEHDENFMGIMKRLLEASMEASFNGVMITEAGPGYPIVYVNPALCEMTGYAPKELLGQSPAMLQGAATDPWVLDQLKEKIEAGDLFHGQTANYRKNGAEFTMEWKIGPIRNDQGTITHYLAIQREVQPASGDV